MEKQFSFNQLPNQQQGNFIVIEGIDGAGSSTQAELLQQYFLNNHQSAVISPEPTNGKIGQLLREFLAEQNYFVAQDLFDQQMAYLFAADRHYHLYNDLDGVYKLIRENIHVISTRYYFSSLAYNVKNQDDYQFVAQLNHNFPKPSILIYLNIPVELALNRIKNRPLKEVYETKDKLIRVKHNFEQIISDYEDNLLVVDASQKPEIINQEIINKIESMS